jgi:hypothetical protein
VAYHNRPFQVEYLGQKTLYGVDDKNLLLDNLWCMLTANAVIATLGGRAAFHFKVILHLRFWVCSNKIETRHGSLDLAQV